jgi:hypothetical protein
VLSHRVERSAVEKTTPLNVPGVLKLLSASAMYAGDVAVLLVAIPHNTSVFQLDVSQLGSVVGSVAFPTVMLSVIVDVP